MVGMNRRSAITRKEFLHVAGFGGLVFASGLGPAYAAKSDEFFVQLSDTHWGFSGPKVNPGAKITLPKAIAAINALERRPDFVVFTGDLTHTTDDDAERRRRMSELKDVISKLEVKDVRFLPGEHDASLDGGGAFREFFGETHYVFDRGGIHFVVLDNTSDAHGAIGGEQLAWLKKDLADRKRDAPIIVLTHRPLFDLAPEWDWATPDGAKALKLLAPFRHVTVFYGHIHQEHHFTTGEVAHHAAHSLIFPLPAPGSRPRKESIPWDADHPFRGLGWRSIEADGVRVTLEETEIAK